MEAKKKNVIIKVDKGSIAEEIGIEPGDLLVSINGKPVLDVFDYRYLIQDEYIEVGIENADGELCIAEIEKEENEDLGIVFESGLMDKARRCSNGCIFCFIDQLPPNMRQTLYFKDDDSRLSFLQGNYVTLTNMSDQDIERILYYHLSPINISVHTTDPELRVKMLRNKNAGKLLDIMKRFASAGIEMNLQVVLCRGINDGAVLDQTIADVSAFYPHGVSMSVVPIGLTKYRKGLYPMQPFDKETSRQVIAQIEKWQKALRKKLGTAFVYGSDEFYLKAEIPLPSAEAYEDFAQLENGVGMIALQEREFTEALAETAAEEVSEKTVSLATGKAAYPFLCSMAKRIEERVPQIQIQVFEIENEFFGSEITVAGLLTGRDIIKQLKDKALGDYLVLPHSLLRSGERVLLDDLYVSDLEEALHTSIRIADNTGRGFLSAVLD